MNVKRKFPLNHINLRSQHSLTPTDQPIAEPIVQSISAVSVVSAGVSVVSVRVSVVSVRVSASVIVSVRVSVVCAVSVSVSVVSVVSVRV